MIQGLPIIIGYLYGLLGIVFLFIFLFYFYVFLSDHGTSVFVLSCFYLLTSAFCFLMLYSFWFLKKWGVCFAIIAHSLWLAYGLVSVANQKLQLTTMSVLSVIFLIFVPLGIIVLLIHPKTRSMVET